MTPTKSTTLHVTGMTCGGCVRHVEAALRAIDGVTACAVTLGDGTVEVAHRADVEREAMIRAVEEAGYGIR